MGYQALLFCPDDKLARVVTQVFTDLDFQVEPVNEPFAAVKKLMAQRYDAVVVDCESEQNATLLFKSARNSTSNQNSLALALVEGQAGVAKAYRIGANLVLTKPINVEQAKGTLRVARGLLRKNADTAVPTSTAPAVPSAPPKPLAPPPVAAPAARVEAGTKSRNVFEPPEFQAALPTMAASTTPETAPAATTPESKKIVADFSAELAKPVLSVPPPPAFKPAPSPIVSTQGAAAAPAPAKEAPVSVPAPTPKKPADSELFEAEVKPAPTRPVETAAPSFAGLGGSEAADDAGGSKKMIMVAAAVIVAAALGYFGWTKFGKSTPAAAPTETHQQAPAPAAPTTQAPTASAASTAPAPASTVVATTPAPPAPAKPSAAVNNSTTKISVANEATKKEAEVPDVVVKKVEPAPIHVKTQGAPAQPPTTATTDESTAAPPSLAAVATGNDKSLNGLVSSTPNLPKVAPSMLRISQGVSQGLLINRVQPKYPQSALSMHIQGPVQMEATIGREGKISNLKVLSGDPVLARAAVDAVKQWRYKPYFLDGEPVEIQTQITVNFKLPN